MESDAEAEARLLERIRQRGLRVSTSASALPSGSADSPRPPPSPALPSPAGFAARWAAAAEGRADAPAAAAAAAAAARPDNPCLPARGSLTPAQMEALSGAVARACAAEAGGDWRDAVREAGRALQKHLLPLSAAAKDAAGRARASAEHRARLRRAFDALADANYIVANELYKLSFASRKPTRLAPSDDEDSDALVAGVRLLACELPQRFEALCARLAELEAEDGGAALVSRLDRRRVAKVAAYVELSAAAAAGGGAR